jgi:hypothetical protein
MIVMIYSQFLDIMINILAGENKKCTNKNSRKKSFWKSFIKRKE